MENDYKNQDFNFVNETEGDISMSAFLDKVGNFFFKSEDEEITDDLSFDEPVIGSEEPKKAAPPKEEKKKKTNLISVPSRNSKTAENLEIVLFKATSYDDMQEIARHIKERKVAVVNFEDMDKDVAQRMVDFLSGAAFALDGVPRKVSGGTFIFSSSQVDVSGQIMAKDGSDTQEPVEEDDRFSSTQWLRS